MAVLVTDHSPAGGICDVTGDDAIGDHGMGIVIDTDAAAVVVGTVSEDSTTGDNGAGGMVGGDAAATATAAPGTPVAFISGDDTVDNGGSGTRHIDPAAVVLGGIVGDDAI